MSSGYPDDRMIVNGECICPEKWFTSARQMEKCLLSRPTVVSSRIHENVHAKFSKVLSGISLCVVCNRSCYYIKSYH